MGGSGQREQEKKKRQVMASGQVSRLLQIPKIWKKLQIQLQHLYSDLVNGKKYLGKGITSNPGSATWDGVDYWGGRGFFPVHYDAQECFMPSLNK